MMLPDIFESAVSSTVVVMTPDASGTGFVVRPDGLLVTNYHVVGHHPRARLQDREGSLGDGEVMLAARRDDLAGIRAGWPLERRQPRPLPLAEPGSVRVGDEVLAIGHPRGAAAFSLARGFVSALTYASLGGARRLQINISVNPGNSGGPLLSADGRVVGVISSINRTPEGQRVEGLALAIPADVLATFVQQVPDFRSLRNDAWYCGVCGRLAWQSRYCDHCGSRKPESNTGAASDKAENMPQECPVCKTVNAIGTRYCQRCGVSLWSRRLTPEK